MNENSSRVIDVDINDILPNRFQPRIQFDEDEILDLSDSIKEHGVIQPLVVRTIGDKYEIIAGERRYKASVLAGKDTVPVIVKNLNDKDSAEIALIENIQRKNLTPIEEALSYKKILDMGYVTQDGLAEKLGKSQPSIANKIRLLNLSDEVQEALLDNKISERHARSLLRLPTSKLQNEMLDKIVKERLTVRKTDDEIDKLKNSKTSEIEEQKGKGELDMNTNLNLGGMPQQPAPNFDIFGTNSANITNAMPQASVESVANPSPVMMSAPVQEPMVSPIMNPVDTFAQNPVPSMPQQPVVENVVPPVMEPTPVAEPSQSVPSIQFDANGFVVSDGTSGMPQASVEPVTNPSPVMMSAPVQEPMVSPIMNPVDTFAQNPVPSMPQQPVVENVVPPVMEPTPVAESSQSIPSIQFDANGFVVSDGSTSMPQASVVENVVPPVVEPAPVAEPSQSIPSIQFDANGFVVSDGTSQLNSSLDQQNSALPDIAIPETKPIVESSTLSSSNFDSPLNTVQTPNNVDNSIQNISSSSSQEPIIITDYNKQYDPIMPTTFEQPIQKEDFREVINAIRECSSKIEKYGYKIDVEEYDLAQLYQVIFKIEK